MTILDSIKDLAKKVTGKAVDGENISEVIDDFANKYEGGIPEVTNAVETHGLGWTETEKVAGFDITWDGNTEGLERFYSHYKVTNDLQGIVSEVDLIGASVNIIVNNTETVTKVLTSDVIQPIDENNKLFAVMSEEHDTLMFIAFEDVTMGEDEDLVEKGIWLLHYSDDIQDMYVSHLYKETTTEEVVHQIDQKYIPSGGSGGSPVEFVDIIADGENDPIVSKTVSELIALGESGKILYVRLYLVTDDIKNFVTAAIATMFDSVSVQFGYSRYSPSTDANCTFIVGYIDDDDGEDKWSVDI